MALLPRFKYINHLQVYYLSEMIVPELPSWFFWLWRWGRNRPKESWAEPRSGCPSSYCTSQQTDGFYLEHYRKHNSASLFALVIC